jgi:hypothetical protein
MKNGNLEYAKHVRNILASEVNLNSLHDKY